MSGGYFDYEDNRLLDFAQKIENEIRCNNNDEETYDEDLCMTLPAGLHASDVTLFLMQKIVEDCDKLAKLLHEFDWYICGDTCEETFIARASEIYELNEDSL